MMNCIICGVGGQGTILASKLLAHAAMEEGYGVRTSETIGMAQRGGSVLSHIRIGNNIRSPLIPKGSADVIIGFEPAEAVRALPFLRKDGFVLVCDRTQKSVSSMLSGDTYTADDMITYIKRITPRVMKFCTDEYFDAGGYPKALNTALLGAAVGCGVFPFGPDALENALECVLPERYLDINKKSFELGRSLCHE